ncbi:MAG: c-type cytochrome domain-containing protein, partial [Planctomycetaceae bacterium]
STAALAAVSIVDPVLCQGQQSGEAKPAAAVSYYRAVRPILQRNCSGCHFAGKREGGLSVTSVAELLKGGDAGAAAVLGKPDEGTLIGNVSGDAPSMPLNGTPKNAQQMQRN